MQFQTPLIPGRLIRRYKRFMADVTLEDGTEVTAHCPNPGAMTGLKNEGLRVWLEPNNDPKRKLKYGWRLVEFADGTWAGIDTGLPNKLVREALDHGRIPELSGYDQVKPEQKYGQNSRIDFLLQGAGLPDAYVEVKSVTLHRGAGLAEFPDSVTARGAKHLADLTGVAHAGHRAVMLYVVQHSACSRLTLADDIDPNYAAAYCAARAAGIETLCYTAAMNAAGVEITTALPIEIG